MLQAAARDADAPAVTLPRPSRPALLACAFAALVLLMFAGVDPWWSDWGSEALPSVELALGGDWSGFVDRAPAYGAGLLLRMPLYLLADAAGVGEVALFRAGALPGLVALAVLAAPFALLATRRAGLLAGGLVVALMAANPLAGQALDYGHPEDLAATAGAVGGVLLALRGRTLWAGLVLGLAVAFKQWAILAVLPAVAAAPSAGWRILPLAGAVALVPSLPFLLGGSLADATAGAAGSSNIFHASQWWWPVGVPAADPESISPLMAPGWLAPIVKPLIVALALPATLLWRRRAGRRPDDVLLLLAGLLLARCALDTWNVHYYHLPLVVALAAWETVRFARPPVLSLACTMAVYLSFTIYPGHYDTGTYLIYAAWTMPLAAFIALELYAPERLSAFGARLRRAGGRPRPAPGPAAAPR